MSLALAPSRKRTLFKPTTPAALVAAVALALGLAACGAASHGGGVRIDDLSRDGAVCGEEDDNNSCSGAVQMQVAANPRRHEYLVVWQGWYTGTVPSDTRLFARRVDAANGRPKGESLDLGGAELKAPLAVAYDQATRTYVIATRTIDPSTGEPDGPLVVRRYDEDLGTVGAPRALGPWTPHALAVEPAGRVAVVGAEHEGPVNSTTAAGRLALRVETLDAHNRTISVARRREPHTDYPGGVTATYDPASRSALVAWLPLPSSDIRIERIRPDGRGGTRTLPVLAEDNPMPVGSFTLACNQPRSECLLLYAVGGTGLTDLYVQRLGPGGRPRGYPRQIARDTGGGIGVAATRGGYTLAWNQGAITGPLTRRVILSHLGAPGTRLQRALDRKLPGPAQYTDGLLVWLAPTGNPSWSRIYGEMVH